MSDNLLNSIENEAAHCDTCNELTPQNHSTTGAFCQICNNVNRYTLERAFTKVDDKWLAAFWRNKYYQVKNPVCGTVFNLNCATGTVAITPATGNEFTKPTFIIK